jgi:hypothetical protein
LADGEDGKDLADLQDLEDGEEITSLFSPSLGFPRQRSESIN